MFFLFLIQYLLSLSLDRCSCSIKANMSSEAFVTLATNDGYALGALVLAQSIRQVGTKRNLAVLISNHLSDLIRLEFEYTFSIDLQNDRSFRKSLEEIFDEVVVVDELDSNDEEHLQLLSRPELGITFTKINCWLLQQYSKCVFLDSDCVVLRPIDDLFDREEFSAAPDAGWPDCFNSGVFVYRPSKETFTKLMLFASQHSASFDGSFLSFFLSLVLIFVFQVVIKVFSTRFFPIGEPEIFLDIFHSHTTLRPMPSTRIYRR